MRISDHKSNHLGDHPGCYRADEMRHAMAKKHYFLQYHLYVVALHRYLRWRLPGYSPQRHLGGYAYVFLRGVPGATEAGAGTGAGKGAVPGVFLERPPLARLLQLDQNLGGVA